MNNITNIFIIAGIVSLISFAGVIFSSQKQNWFFKNSKYLVVFAAGVFTFTSLNLMSEVFEFLSNTTGIVTIIFGFVGMLILHKLLPETHHHHDQDCGSCVTPKSGTKILIGDFIHNITDGIVLVAAFSISKEIGLVVALSIVIHEIIQEIGEYIVLRNAGFSQKKALVYNFLSSLSIFIGVGIGLFLTQDVKLQAALLGVSAGVFLHIVFHDLIPYDKIRKIQNRDSWNYIGLFLLGTVTMMSVGLLTPHTHSDGSEDHGDHLHESSNNHLEHNEEKGIHNDHDHGTETH